MEAGGGGGGGTSSSTDPRTERATPADAPAEDAARARLSGIVLNPAPGAAVPTADAAAGRPTTDPAGVRPTTDTAGVRCVAGIAEKLEAGVRNSSWLPLSSSSESTV